MVAGAKLILGYATGTVSVLSDGFHSLTDAASNIIGLVGIPWTFISGKVDWMYNAAMWAAFTGARLAGACVRDQVRPRQ